MAELDLGKQREELRNGLVGLAALLVVVVGAIVIYRGCSAPTAPLAATAPPMAESGFTIIDGTDDVMLQKLVEKYLPMVEGEVGKKFKNPVRIMSMESVERPDDDLTECGIPFDPKVDLAATTADGSAIYFFEDLRKALVEPQVQISTRERDPDAPALPPRWKTRLLQRPFAGTKECVEAAVIHQLVHSLQWQNRSVKVDMGASSDEHELAGYTVRYEGLAEYATKKILGKMNRVDVYELHVQAVDACGHSAYVVHQIGLKYFEWMEARGLKPGLSDFDRALSFAEVCEAAGVPAARPKESPPPRIPFDEKEIQEALKRLDRHPHKKR